MASKSSPVTSSVALYGNRNLGFGFLATGRGFEGMLGTGEPGAYETVTEAVWSAAAQLRAEGVRGICRVVDQLDSFRIRYADFDLHGFIPTAGYMEWTVEDIG